MSFLREYEEHCAAAKEAAQSPSSSSTPIIKQRQELSIRTHFITLDSDSVSGPLSEHQKRKLLFSDSKNVILFPLTYVFEHLICQEASSFAMHVLDQKVAT